MADVVPLGGGSGSLTPTGQWELVAFELVTDATAGQTLVWSGGFSLTPDSGSYGPSDLVDVDFCYQQLGTDTAVPVGLVTTWPLRGTDVVSAIPASGTWLSDLTGEYYFGICVSVLTENNVTVDSISGWLMRTN